MFQLDTYDLFAPGIGLMYKGTYDYRTKFGGIASILTLLLFAFILSIKVSEIKGYETANFYTTKTIRDINEPIDLAKLNFTFALNYIDPSIANITAYQVHIPWENHRRDKVKIPIPIVDCQELPEHNGQLGHEALSRNRFYKNDTFLCPNTTEMIIQGNEYSDIWSYVEIEIYGCQLPEDECADISEVENTFFNFFYQTSHADFADATTDNPLKLEDKANTIIVLDPKTE